MVEAAESNDRNDEGAADRLAVICDKDKAMK
jgi:hypothetical protein